MELKPQDLVVVFMQVAHADHVWTYASLGEALQMSPSHVHRSVKRCITSGLAVEKARGEWQTVRTALFEFAVHGARYAFPAQLGKPQRGVPTAFGVPPLANEIRSAPHEIPVWPCPAGSSRGPSVAPLYRALPEVCLHDAALHELLALQDALRIGRARERSLATRFLKQRLQLVDPPMPLNSEADAG